MNSPRRPLFSEIYPSIFHDLHIPYRRKVNKGETITNGSSLDNIEYLIYVKGEPELTDPFNLLINVKLRMLWNWNFFYSKEEHFYGNIVS